MSFEQAEIFYLCNLLFAVSYSTAMFVYMGRHDMRASSARALQRLLAGIISWAFYDVIMARVGQVADGETAFLLFRLLSFMWLAIGGLAGEQIIALIRPVEGKLRALICFPFVLMYIVHVLFPEYTSAGAYGIEGGWKTYPGPWQVAYNTMWLAMFTALACWLGVAIRRERDPRAKSEKLVLLAGILLSIAGLGVSRVLLQRLGPGFPALGNIAMALFALAAFIGLKRYGRVISPRTIYWTTVNSIPSGLAHVHKGRVTWTNRVFPEMLGIPGDDALGGTMDDLLRGREGARGAESAGGSGGAHGLPVNGVVRRGDSYLMVSATPLDPDDPGQGTLYVVMDITDREKAGEAVRESEERYRVLIENAGEAVVVAQGGYIVFANPMAMAVTGYALEEIPLRPFIEFVHPGDREMVAQNYRNRLAGLPVPEAYEFRLLRRDGAVRWAEIRAVRISWNGGPATLNMIADITERRRVEDALAAALTEKESMYRELQHRIKNSLAMIGGLINLESSAAGSPELREKLGMLGRRVRALADLYTMLYETGTSEGVSIAGFLGRVRDSIYLSLADTAGKIAVRIQGDDIFIGIKKAAPLGLIVTELVTNALKYAFPGGKSGAIEVIISTLDSGMRLVVSDNGIGLPPGIRLEESKGLGLQLVRMLVEQLDGTIALGGEKGAAFTIDIPLD